MTPRLTRRTLRAQHRVRIMQYWNVTISALPHSRFSCQYAHLLSGLALVEEMKCVRNVHHERHFQLELRCRLFAMSQCHLVSVQDSLPTFRYLGRQTQLWAARHANTTD